MILAGLISSEIHHITDDDATHIYVFHHAYNDMGQVTKLRLFYYLVLLSIDSKTR